jgi:biotin operon repressor
LHRGYVCLWRKTIESRVFQNEGLFKVWAWCLMRANHKRQWVGIKSGKGIVEVEVKPGQFIFGRQAAARELKMAPSTVWKRIQKLKNIENLNINSNSQYSIVSIINWEHYQPQKIKGDSKGDSQGTAKEHRQECKEYNTRGKPARKTGAPDIFPVTPEMKKYANEKGYIKDLEVMTESFLIHHRANGSEFSSWYAAWQKWLRNDIKWNPPQKPEPPLAELMS